MRLRELLRVKREEAGLSLSQCSAAAGITKSHLHDMECGRSWNPTVRTAAALALVLNVPINLLVAAAVESDRSEVGAV